ncbi:MAG: YHS domain-containing protein [Thermoguttaceae bacterium]
MATTKTDPVCKMDVSTKDAKQISRHQGETYYFCGSTCKNKFDKEPERYVGPTKSATKK